MVDRSASLNGAELRFLRTEMELTQRDLAGIIGATEQTLRLWERNSAKHFPGTADRLLRALYSEFLRGDVHIRKMLEKLADLDRMENEPTCFSKTNSSWKPRATPALELVSLQRRVGRAEGHRLCEDLLDAGSRPDRLIVQTVAVSFL